MLAFERLSSRGTDRAELPPKTLIIAGWTGRDEKALHHHIEELAAIGVPRPSSVPVFYRISTANLTQTARLEVLGSDTSRSEEHTSELQSLRHLVCRLLLEKKKQI